MANYDYINGKKRIQTILRNRLDVETEDKLPTENDFTFSNAYYSWVTGLFVDIRDSTTLFSDEDKVKISKIIKSFTSEVIEILKDDDNLREIGIRGDCVYAVYTTPQKKDIYEIVEKAVWVNTFMKMLNKLLNENNFPTIKVGIGVASSQELVIKAGRYGSGINNLVWVGKAVSHASKFSNMGNKNELAPIILSSCTYSNIIDQYKINNPNAESWFTARSDFDLGDYYDVDLVKTDFNNWIKSGMQ